MGNALSHPFPLGARLCFLCRSLGCRVPRHSVPTVIELRIKATHLPNASISCFVERVLCRALGRDNLALALGLSVLGSQVPGQDPGASESVQYQRQHICSTASKTYLLKGEGQEWRPREGGGSVFGTGDGHKLGMNFFSPWSSLCH